MSAGRARWGRTTNSSDSAITPETTTTGISIGGRRLAAEKLIVKDFQANQSQRLVFLVDCGRMMTGEAAGVSLLDHALNAMLMLSFVALRQGDKVGLLCFSDRIQTFLPPAGGGAQTNRLLHAAYDRFPEMVESRYDEAFLHFGFPCAKTSVGDSNYQCDR